LIAGATNEPDKNIRNGIIGSIVGLHVVLIPGIIIFITVYLPYRRAPKTDNMKKVRLIILGLIVAGALMVIGIVLMSAWKLFASGSGAFVLVAYALLYLFLQTDCSKRYIKTKTCKRTILLLFLVVITLTIIIVFLVVLDDKADAVLEIISFVIYL